LLKEQYCIPAGLASVCKLFGVTRQAYYKQNKREDTITLHHEIVLEMVENIRRIPQWKRLGTEKLHKRLKPDFERLGVKMGRIALDTLLARYGLQVRCRRKRVITTNSDHGFKWYPNLIENLTVDAPGFVWVSDITYITVAQSFMFLFLITDLYSRKIIGYNLAMTLEAIGGIKALDMAIKQWQPISDNPLIHHSDRGIQYSCNIYIQALTSKNIKSSMAAKGNPYQNAVAERVNGILKFDMALDRNYASLEEAIQATATTIDMYNNERQHKSINNLTPAVAHTMKGVIPRKW
jgi:putative transposase